MIGNRLLALDQSSHVTGWSFFEDGELKDYGTFEFYQDDLGERLYLIKEKVKSFIHNLDINYLVIEDIQLQGSVGSNPKIFKMLAEVIGVLFELAYEEKVPIEAILASQWRSALKIKSASRKRSDQKKATQQYVLDTYGIKASEDACDAICIGASFAKVSKSNEELNW